MNKRTIIGTTLAAALVLTAAVSPLGAAKPQDVIQASNGFPSGAHFNLNIHGKDPATFAPDLTLSGGGSVFVNIKQKCPFLVCVVVLALTALVSNVACRVDVLPKERLPAREDNDRFGECGDLIEKLQALLGAQFTGIGAPQRRGAAVATGQVAAPGHLPGDHPEGVG